MDTYILRTKVHKDRIVYFSGHFDANFTDPRESPYNFFVGTDYSTSLRAALKFAKEQGAKRFVFIYPEHPYGKNPIPAGKEYAEQIDLEVGPDQIVDLRAIDATSQLTYMKKFDPDFAWIGGTAASAAVILRDAAKLGLRTKFIVNCWGFDEDLLKLAGEAAEDRAFGVLPVAPWGAEVPGMKQVLASAADPVHSSHYVKGWVAMLVIAEGLIRAHRSGAIDGTGIKNALETLTDFDTGGLTAPITFTSRDHRPNTSLPIYTVVKGLKMSKTQDIHLPRDPRQVGR